MSRPILDKFTRHAKDRVKRRKVPEHVLTLFQEGKAFIAQGRKEDGLVTNYHVIRVGSTEYYVGVERENVAVTFIHVTTPYGWFKNRIFNFKHMYEQIIRLPVAYASKKTKAKKTRHPNTRSKREITEELMRMYNVGT